MKSIDLVDFLKRTKIDDNNLLNLYFYGSRVYGCDDFKSDFDFIAIVKNKNSDQYSDNLIDVTFYTPDQFQYRIDEHEISALECLFLDKKFILKETLKFNFKLNKSKLRNSLSAKSSNSFVKSKKKLTIDKDYDERVGKKSLFHSFRIICFGIQIVKYGRIVDYKVCNDLLKEIYKIDTWDKLFLKYKKDYNNLISSFREICPK